MLPGLAVLLVALLLSACCFSPIYKIDCTRDGSVSLAALALPNTDNGRLLAQALNGRWQADERALFDMRITLDEAARDSQLNEAGVGARIELS